MQSSCYIDLEKYYGLVVYKARKQYAKIPETARNHIEYRELFQEGYLGLLEAAKSYDPNKKVQFSTYANWRIMGAMLDYLRRLDPLTQRERMKINELGKKRRKLIEILGRDPDSAELAEWLDISEEELRKIERLQVFILSLDELTSPADCALDQKPLEIPHSDPDPESKLIMDCSDEEQRRLADDVNGCLENALNEDEKNVLTMRILGELTLQVVGRLLNFSKDTVSRREKSAKLKMRECLNDKDWEISDIIALIP
jgi:RNA polymerase sigma factor FliA